MPWKLKAPHTRSDGKEIEFFYVRGKYLGIRLDHSTGTRDEAAAKRILATWRKQAERGEFSVGQPAQAAPATFVKAAIAYMQAGGSGQYLAPIMKAWPTRIAADIDQIALDTLAVELYPKASPATRNRQVHTPVSAVLKRAGIEKKFKRPIGWQGNKSTSWLEPDQAFALFKAADEIDLEFGLLCQSILYAGGLRLDEMLSRLREDLRLERAYLRLPDSKNGHPRGCHLPDYLVQRFKSQPAREVTEVRRNEHGHFLTGKPLEDAGVPFLDRDPKAKLFRFHDGGALRDMLKAAMTAAGLSFPRRQGGFHIFCHTYGSWMHQYGGLDAHGLTETKRWIDPDSAWRYVHTSASKAAQLADLFPTPKGGQLVDMKTRVS